MGRLILISLIEGRRFRIEFQIYIIYKRNRRKIRC
jgi:hypothetical protein